MSVPVGNQRVDNFDERQRIVLATFVCVRRFNSQAQKT
jgi:hypothetical protein